MRHFILAAAIGCTSVISIPQPSFAGDKIAEAFQNGKAYVNFRYRYENVDQDGPAPITEDAHASTLRTNLGYETGDFYGFLGKVEIQDVTHIGDDNFNDTVNLNTTHPTVADPDTTEINEAYIQYSGLIPDTTIKAGRQIVNLGNQRFIGSVGWRQNDQTHDGVVVVNKSLPDTSVTYGYSANVNRVFSEDATAGDLEGDTHIAHVTYSGLKDMIGDISGYYYKINVDEAAALNSETWGINLKGARKINDDFTFKYYAEWASQDDGDTNPTSYDADYYHINPALTWKNLNLFAGYEVLEADSGAGIAFSTPLATLHKFNGWADKFLGTPIAGLEDAYVGFGYKVKDVHEHLDGTVFKFIYHRFDAETGSADYGDEYNVMVKKKFMDNYYVQFKYANFDADSSAPASFTDTEKFWFTIGANFDLLKPKNQPNQ